MNSAKFEVKINGEITYVDIPTQCPHCGLAVEPSSIDAVSIIELFGNPCRRHMVVVKIKCPASKCKKHYLSIYHIDSGDVKPSGRIYKTAKLFQYPQPWSNQFDSSISDNLPRFVAAYNDAMTVYSQGMEELAGCGFRRALEYMIHDYALDFYPDKKEHIENPKTTLACKIETYCESEDIKTFAKASTWLGNDFVHPVKRHDQPVVQLIKMVDACSYFMSMRYKMREAQTFLAGGSLPSE